MSVVVLSLALLVVGCGVGSYRARNVDLAQSSLISPDLYVKGGDEEAIYRYVNPNVEIKSYTQVIVDPVLVTKGGELDAETRENYQTLANNAHHYLTVALEKSYKVVTVPGPGVFRVQMAIVDAEGSKAVMSTLSTIVPVSAAVSAAKYAASGKQTGVGEITVEIKVTDSMAGTLMGAALDRRVGGKQLTKLWSTWNSADDALQYWARRTAYVLCQMRGGTDCVKP